MFSQETQCARWLLLRDLTGNQPLRVKVTGDCMAPLLPDGCGIDVMPAKVYWPGDVIMVVPAAGGAPFVHRLIGYLWLDGTFRYLTQADNCRRPDGPVTRQQIIGRLAGGRCSPMLISVPIRHRILALSSFCRFFLRGCLKRTWSLLNPT